MDLSEETLSREYLYRGKIVNLRRDEVKLPGGKTGKREIVEHPGGAGILCVREGKVVLVRQFRYAYGEELLEIPAGKLEKGEDPLLAARRELSEETGLCAEKLKLFLILYPTPGYSNEKIYLFSAEETSEGEQRLDEDEFLSVVEVPLEEAVKMIWEGRIKDAKTIAALLYAVK